MKKQHLSANTSEEKNQNHVFSKIIFRLVFLIFVGVVVYVLFFSPFVEIKRVCLEGITELNYEDVNQKIKGFLEQKYFKFVAKDNFIIFPSNKLKAELLNDFKKISDIEIKKVFPDEITVKITERKALLIWCSAGPCYIVDENGYAYSWIDLESEEVKQNNLLSLIDDSGKTLDIGEKILDSEYIKSAILLKDELDKGTGIKIINEYRTGSRMAEEIKVKTEEGWEIYFSTRMSVEDSIQTLKTFLEKGIVNGDNKDDLEYIDLRAENRVYYKFGRRQGDSEKKAADNTDNVDAQQSVDANKKDDKKKK